MNKIKLRAVAKINLGLDVIRRKENGYHEVKMIMQTINLYDHIEIRKTKQPGIQVKTNLYYLPVNENNLVYKAAKLLIDEFHITQGVSMELKKHIPVAAGMAGGSSDAATVLFGINRMFELGLSKEELMERGVGIGADVPYCILRGTALAEGIGEKLSVLPPMPKCHILIAKPGISVSTKFVYGNLNLEKVEEHPDIDRIIHGIRQEDLNLIGDSMGNILETVTIPAYPVIDEIKSVMKRYGAAGAMMSGSGPTVFGLYKESGAAKRAYHELKTKHLAKQVYLTSIFNNRR